MNKKILELKETRLKAWESMKSLDQLAINEKRTLSKDEKSQWDKAQSEIGTIDEQITEERANLKRDEFRNQMKEKREDRKKVKKDTKEVTYDGAFEKFKRSGMSSLTNEERSLMQERAQATYTDAKGGYAVNETLASQLEEYEKIWGGMMQVSEIITTAKGGTFNQPTDDDTAETGEWLAENTQVGEQDVTLGNVSMQDYVVSSKMIRASLQIVNDFEYNLDAWLGRKAGRRIGVTANLAFTSGDGVNKPTGFITDATTGVTGAAAAITFDNIIDLIHSVDPAYRRAGTLMLNDSTLAAVRKLKDSNGQYIWQPSAVIGEPDRIMGFNYVVNQDLADIGAGNTPVAFGDFSKYIIRKVRNPILMRLTERYADYLQVGFILFERLDGKLINTSAIKLFANA